MHRLNFAAQLALPGGEAGGRASRQAPRDAGGRGGAGWEGRGRSREEQRVGAGREELQGEAGTEKPPQVQWKERADCAGDRRDCLDFAFGVRTLPNLKPLRFSSCVSSIS